MSQTEIETNCQKDWSLGHILSGQNGIHLTTDDVTLVPSLGKLESRSDAELGGFIYSSPMDTVTGEALTDSIVEQGHYAVACRFLPEEWFESFTKHHGNENVFFAIGSKKKDTEMLLAAIGLGIEEELQSLASVSINIDVAHGDTHHLHKLYKWYSTQPFVKQLMSGSICTPGAAIRCVANGCTHIRVGIGPGSACTTRMKTGCGVPQLSAVYQIHQGLIAAGLRGKVKLIADGGVRNPGDAVKYMAAGADGIMLGRRLSECPESCGWVNTREHWWQKRTLSKSYRGQASAQFQKERLGKTPQCAEGASGPTIYPGAPLQSVINEFEGGVRSALSYLGLESINDLGPENVKFLRVTPSAIVEGSPHGTQQ